jgi:hypothetical protein
MGFYLGVEKIFTPLLAPVDRAGVAVASAFLDLQNTKNALYTLYLTQ